VNRREAIRKLAAGGAVAVGASAVVSTRDVAYAASPANTNLSNVPAELDPLPISFSANANGTVTIGDVTPAACIGGGTPTITYSWKVNGFSLSGGNRHLLVVNASNPNDVIHDTTSSTGYSSPSTSHPAVELRKTNNGKKRTIKPLDSSDSYNVSVIVTWQCGGENSALEAEYTFAGVGSNPPSVGNTAYNVI
jgi:hypothetical protein